MNPLGIGAAIAAVLAGPPLYALVQTGELDSTGALVRGLIVMLVSTAGVSYIFKLTNSYSEDIRRREVIEELTAAIEAAHAKDAKSPGTSSASGVAGSAGASIPMQAGSPTDVHTPTN